MTLDQSHEQNPQQLYERMRPDQRTAVANEFVRTLRVAGDPEAERFRRETQAAAEYVPQRTTPETTDDEGATPLASDENDAAALLSPEQVARIHAYTRDRHPDLFEQVMHHPVTVSAMSAPGAEDATAASDEQAERQQPPQTEADPHVHMTGPIRSGLVMSELGGFENNRLMQVPPHERDVTPNGDYEADRELDDAQQEAP